MEIIGRDPFERMVLVRTICEKSGCETLGWVNVIFECEDGGVSAFICRHCHLMHTVDALRMPLSEFYALPVVNVDGEPIDVRVIRDYIFCQMWDVIRYGNDDRFDALIALMVDYVSIMERKPVMYWGCRNIGGVQVGDVVYRLRD